MTGHGRHTIAVRWHLAQDTLLRLVPGGAVVTAKTGDFDVMVTATAVMQIMGRFRQSGMAYTIVAALVLWTMWFYPGH